MAGMLSVAEQLRQRLLKRRRLTGQEVESRFDGESASMTEHVIPQKEEHARSEFRTHETVRYLIFG